MDQDLRLRLVVRRHGVPDVKLLWTATVNQDLTVSRFVAQVDEVIPLESGEWGLEDYAVELRDASGEGFECIHYHLVSKLFKDNDQVLIRPLLTDDLKRRRLSGRHQISADGRHLVDGLAYGRTWLKAPQNRPAVTLPPRKKARIAYDSDDEVNDPSDGDELRMIEYDSARARQRSKRAEDETDHSDMDDSDNDDDFEPEEDDDVGMGEDAIQEELRLLHESDLPFGVSDRLPEPQTARGRRARRSAGSRPSVSFQDHSPVPTPDNALIRSPSKTSPVPDASSRVINNRHAGESTPSVSVETLDQVVALRAAYPSATSLYLLEGLRCCKGNLEEAYQWVGQFLVPEVSLEEMLVRQAASLSASPIRQGIEQERPQRIASPSHRGLAKAADLSTESEQESETLNHTTGADQVEVNDEAADFEPTPQPESSIAASDLKSPVQSEASEDDADAELDLDRHEETGAPDSDAAISDSDSASESDSSGASSDESSSADDSEDVSEDSDVEGDDVEDAENDAPTQDRSSHVGDGDSSAGESKSDHSDSEDPDDTIRASTTTKDAQPVDSSAASGAESDSSSDSSDDDSSDEEIFLNSRSSPSRQRKSVAESSSDESSDSESSEDSDSEDSNSESEPEEVPTKTLSNQHRHLQASLASAPSKASPNLNSVDEPRTVPPGEGLSRTQKRNARRKLAKRMSAQARSSSGQQSREVSQPVASEALDEVAALLARKKALLEAIATEEAGEAAEPQSQGHEKSPEIPNSVPQDATMAGTDDATEHTPSQEANASARRIKPNVGAARRMLMGSLGLKNPKSKADEDRIRQDLMKGVRPHTNARLAKASGSSEAGQAQELVDEDPDAWREKITYRGVECCHEGIELSEPPFPFVQRWDPQQQVEQWFGSKKRGGKRKRVQHDQAPHDDDGSSQASKKRRLVNGVAFSDGAEDIEGDTTLNYDDPVEETVLGPHSGESDRTKEINLDQAVMEESQMTDLEDLPSLPEDVSTLPNLLPGEAKLGMVVTWKEWVLGSGTNWQPEVVNVTGVVVRVYDKEATEFEFLLAYRDRKQDEKVYDETTGQRVYDRFEAPDDDEEDEIDEGYRRLKYADLTEPKILQQPMDEKEKQSRRGQLGAPNDSNMQESAYDGLDQQSKRQEAGRSEADVGSQSPVEVKDGRAQANTESEQPVEDANNRLDASLVGERSHVQTQRNGSPYQNDITLRQPTVDNSAQATQEAHTPGGTPSQHQTSPSITSDRRREISLLIEEAGFRKDVSPSLARPRRDSSVRGQDEKPFNTYASQSKSPTVEPSQSKANTPVLSQSLGDAPPSTASSVLSGRQPGVDLEYDMGYDLPQMDETMNGSPVLGESTPKASLCTPRRKRVSEEPSTADSFPSLDHIFLTATSEQRTQSPSGTRMVPPFRSEGSALKADAEYEAAMRRLDDGESEDEDDKEEEDEDESQPPRPFSNTRKRLFPNSSQPAPSRSPELPELPDVKPRFNTAPSSFTESQDVKPSARNGRRKSSPFRVPEGSQVITLSSSRPSSPGLEFTEYYAEDDIDKDYEEKSSSLPRGPGWVQKNKPPRAKLRAKSTPAGSAAARTGGESSLAPSTRPIKLILKSRGQRKSSGGF
ncbi:hypothetical protein CTRI78_v001829 [Colletotrichum trifolii]|uniref:DUF7357 domain-containing protein n=1 Tax=Colletotrichum trifolii TaxID=5466 RepID=A0A4R8RN64_COLTR|nr:hypothetical protein CTRI78_v001829 [Colletotrichum trifolii]